MKKVSLNASVYAKLQKERQLSKKPVKHPVVQSEVRSLSFPGTSKRWEQDTVFVGRVPNRAVVGVVDSRAFNGHLQYYPFAFQKYGITRVRQMIDGEEYPARAFELTGDEGYEDLVGYHNLLKSMGHLEHHKPCMIHPGDWGQGNNCTLFTFNDVPSGGADDPKHRNPRQSGNVRYGIDFEPVLAPMSPSSSSASTKTYMRSTI